LVLKNQVNHDAFKSEMVIIPGLPAGASVALALEQLNNTFNYDAPAKNAILKMYKWRYWLLECLYP